MIEGGCTAKGFAGGVAMLSVGAFDCASVLGIRARMLVTNVAGLCSCPSFSVVSCCIVVADGVEILLTLPPVAFPLGVDCVVCVAGWLSVISGGANVRQSSIKS